MTITSTPAGLPARRPPRPRLASALATAVLALSALLAACGPGVGGTGTGVSPNVGPAHFGATSEPLCGADFAAALDCASPAAGTAPLLLADGDPAQQASGRVADQRMELRWLCEDWAFEGDWGRAAPPRGLRFYGTARNGDGVTLAAMLSVRAEGTALVAELQDELGVALAGPVTLQRMPAPVTLTPRCG